MGSLMREAKKKDSKRKPKTKFEEFLAMDMMNKFAAGAEEDLELERRLATKLRVKGGKLKSSDDGMDELIVGIPSMLDSMFDDGDENDMIVDDEVSSSKKRRRKKSVKASGEKLEDEGAADLPKMEEKAPEVDVSVKYVAPHLRASTNKESEEILQVRRRMRGLLNRISESNVESITGEVAAIFRSLSRSVGCQIISEEVVVSCSRGPRGNEQYYF